MTTRNEPSLSWRQEVISLLAASGSNRSQLAEELEVHRATVLRMLDGRHHPKADTIIAVSEATASLVASRIRRTPQSEAVEERVFDYLSAVAASELGDPADAAAQGLALGIGFVEGYASPRAVERISRVVQRRILQERSRKVHPADRATTKLGLRLLIQIRRILLDMARSVSTTESRFDEVADVFGSFDPSLKGAVEVRTDVLPIVVYERFSSKVAKAISRYVHDRNERLALQIELEVIVRSLVNDLNTL